MTILEWIKIISIIVAIFLSIGLSAYALWKSVKQGFTKKVTGYFVSGLGCLFIVYLAINISNIEPAGHAQIMLTIGLVAVTGIYALATIKQAEASVKMAEETRSQRYAEALPLLVPTITQDWNTQILEPNEIPYVYLQTGIGIKVKWHNLGKGVAINSRFSLWTASLDSSPGKAPFLPPLESVSIGIGENKEINFHEAWGGKVYDIPNTHHPRLEATYQDIYERKVTTIQEFRIKEENTRKRAFLGELYFTVNGRRLVEEIKDD